jgi:MOSC domain-containing protein YiiM
MAGVDDGRLLQINVSPGGVPKLPISEARVTLLGIEGDRQREETVHGGPHRAVSILGIEAIERVAAEGHPIGPGTTGENLTIAGFDVSSLPVGTRLAIGDEVVLELAGPANPCRTIRHSFAELRFGRLSAAAHPADSRMYARVVSEGTLRPGDPIHVRPPTDDGAARFVINDRLDRVERESSLSFWRAAQAAGLDVRIMDDGEIAAAAAPRLPASPSTSPWASRTCPTSSTERSPTSRPMAPPDG